MVHFKEFESTRMDINDESLITIRDILLKSPHFESCTIKDYYVDEESPRDVIIERTDRIMSEDPAYEVDTHRFWIQKCKDYFQFEFYMSHFWITLVIEKVAGD